MHLGVPALTLGSFLFDLFADLQWNSFLLQCHFRFCWLAWSRLNHCLYCESHQHFGGESVEITHYTHSGWQASCSTACFGGLWDSDLITPVRWATPLHSFHMEKMHPTEVGYPDWWTARVTRLGLGSPTEHVNMIKNKERLVTPRRRWSPYLPKVFHVNRP